MANVPVSKHGRKRPTKTGKTAHGSVMGKGTKITGLNTKAVFEARELSVEQWDSARDIGGSGSLFQALDDIFFQAQPTVLKANVVTIDVRARVATNGLLPDSIDHYFGVWPSGATPSDADVKAGTGAIEHASVLAQPSGIFIDHSFPGPTVVVGTTYSLHWYAEHVASGEDVRSNTLSFIVNNSAPTGSPYITGTPTVLETLTANTELIADADGLGAFSYQWYRNRVSIPGATLVTYDLVEADKKTRVKVAVMYLDGNDTVEGPLFSAEVGPIAAINYPPTGEPIIVGDTVEGETLEGQRGTLDDPNGINPYSPEITWRRDGTTIIPGAVGVLYVLTAADVGSTIEVGIEYTDDDDFREGPVYSDPTATVTPFNRPATGKPAITGDALEGELLTCTEGTVADLNGLPVIGEWSFQWRRDVPEANFTVFSLDDIAGATMQTYMVTAADVGATLDVGISFTDDDGFDEGPLYSDPTILVNQFNREATGAPAITGDVDEGEILTAIAGTVADDNGVPDISIWEWQWQRGTTPLLGAIDETYLIVPADVGNTLRVCASFEDDAGYPEGPLYSADTIMVPGDNQAPSGIPVITGPVLEGETVTADVSGITDPDGIVGGSFIYQWQRDLGDVPGRTASTYAIDGNDVGSKLSVYVHFDDMGGTHEGPLYSIETITVVRFNRPATGTPGISGTVAVYNTVSASIGTLVDANGLPPVEEWDIQWYLDGGLIVGETGTSYTIISQDILMELSYTASFTDDDDYPEGPFVSVIALVPMPDVEHLQDFSESVLGVFSYGRLSDDTVIDCDSSLRTVGDGVPAFVGGDLDGVDWSDAGVGYGIQLQEPRSNLKIKANDPSDITTGAGTGENWGHQALLAVTGDGIPTQIGPQGHFITPNTSNTWHALRCFHKTVGAGIYTFRHLVKDNGYEWLSFLTTATGYPGANWLNVNIVTGLLGNSNMGGVLRLVGVTRDYKTGYYIVEVCATSDGSGGSGGADVLVAIYDQDYNAPIQEFAGDGVSGMIWAGCDIQFGPFSTAYIDSDLTVKPRAESMLLGFFADMPQMPIGGLVNDYCFQFTVVLDADLADLTDMTRIVTVGTGVTSAELLLININHATSSIQFRRFVSGQPEVKVEVTYPVLLAGDLLACSVLVSSTTGLTGWVNSEPKENDPAPSLDHVIPLLGMVVGANYDATTRHFTSIFPVVRSVAIDLSDALIEAWDTWTPPVPRITADPEDQHFGSPDELEPVDPVVISMQPADSLVSDGDDAVFTVVVAGTPPIDYSWQVDTGGGFVDVLTVYPDAQNHTTQQMTLPAVSFGDGGQFQVTVSNDSGLNVAMSNGLARLSVASMPLPVGDAVLLFSDMVNGPNQGWSIAESTKGAAITIWGKGFGETRGANYVSVGGVNLESPDDYAEWGIPGKPIPWLEHITFYLNSSMTPGPTTITVNIGGSPTQTLPFTVRDDLAGSIKFVELGAVGLEDGTFENPYADPEPILTPGVLVAGDVCYLREGTYDKQYRSGGAVLWLNNNVENGTENEPIAVCSYPGEVATLFSHYGENINPEKGISSRGHYYVFSRFTIVSSTNAVSIGSTGPIRGNYSRVVGNDCTGCLEMSAGTGVIKTESAGVKTLGNTMHGARTDSRYDHGFYQGGDPWDDLNTVDSEVAHNHIYDNTIGVGPNLSINHKSDRIAAGHNFLSCFVHHNLINCLSTVVGSEHPATRGIGVANVGGHRAGEVDPEPVYIYNNIVYTDADWVGDGSTAINWAAEGWGEFYNNTVINSSGLGFTNINISAGETDGAHITFNNNMMITTNPANKYLHQTLNSGNVELIADSNSFFGGDEATIFGDNPKIEFPEFYYDINTYSFELSPNSTVIGAGIDPGLAAQLFDYNYEIYSGSFDIGAVQQRGSPGVFVA